MFQVTVNNADHPNIIADAFQFRDQRAHAADQQVNRYARAGRGVQPVHQSFVDQIVKLQGDAGRQPFLSIGNLFINHIVQQTARVLRRDQQIVEADRAVRVLNEVKDPAYLVGDARIGG